jgi:hypothetical protein
MTISELIIPTYMQTLRALSAWLDKGAAFEEAAGRDPDALLSLRLVPDMFPLATQLLFCLFQSRESVHRLRGEEIPEATLELRQAGRDGGEQPGTLAGARERIAETLDFLARVDPDCLDAGGGRPLALDLPTGHIFDTTGEQFVRDWALPQYYFHLMAAYLILRNRGVALGKIDFVPWMSSYLRPGTPPEG